MASKCKICSNIDREEKETFCECLGISSNRSIFNTHIHTIFDVKVDRKKGMNANNLTISLFITVCWEHDQYVYSKREKRKKKNSTWNFAFWENRTLSLNILSVLLHSTNCIRTHTTTTNATTTTTTITNNIGKPNRMPSLLLSLSFKREKDIFLIKKSIENGHQTKN